MNDDEKKAFLATLGARVKMARELKGLEITDASKAISAKTATVIAIEAGAYDPSITQLHGLATLFGVKPSLLLPSTI